MRDCAYHRLNPQRKGSRNFWYRYCILSCLFLGYYWRMFLWMYPNRIFIKKTWRSWRNRQKTWPPQEKPVKKQQKARKLSKKIREVVRVNLQRRLSENSRRLFAVREAIPMPVLMRELAGRLIMIGLTLRGSFLTILLRKCRKILSTE